MTIYEELYNEITDLLRFYRFEGNISFPYFDFKEYNNINNILRYVYFSGNAKHHKYYVKKRIIQLINNEILKNSQLSLHYKSLLNPNNFKEIINAIENYQLQSEMISIECSVSQIFYSLLRKNYIVNTSKKSPDRRIERVDCRKHQGGYGFCDKWLDIFNILTYFYSYQRITKENILDFIYAYRQTLIKSSLNTDPTFFLLNQKNRVVKINERIYYDFAKYDLMNDLQIIVENNMFFPQSILAKEPQEQIKKIIQQYSSEREYILELSKNAYQKHINKI